MEDFEVYEEHNEEETKQETFQEDVKAADMNMSGKPETKRSHPLSGGIAMHVS